MWTKKYSFLLVAAAVILSGAACKKSVEGETKRWDAAIRQAEELKALYPAFSAALDQQLQTARSAMERAMATNDEEARIKQMAEANGLLTRGFVGELRGLDGQIKALRSKVVSATSGAADEADRLAAKAASEGAERVIASVDELLRRGATDAASAGTVVKKAAADLKAAGANLDKVLNLAKQKQQELKQATEEAAAAGAAAAAATQPAKKTWKCTYCNSTWDDDVQKCKSCGAARD